MRVTRNVFRIILLSMTIAGILIASSPLLQSANTSLYSWYISKISALHDIPAHKDIIVVEIDDVSLGKLGGYPLKRDIYAQVIENLNEYDVAAIAFDVLFLDALSQSQDQKFLSSETDNIIYGAAINAAGEIELPFFADQLEAHQIGLLPPIIDGKTKLVLGLMPERFFPLRDIFFHHISLQITKQYFRHFYGETISSELSVGSSGFSFGDRLHIRSEREASTHVRPHFIHPGNFRKLSLHEAYDAELLSNYDQTNPLDNSMLIIGPTAQGLGDYFFTPAGKIHGVYVHANAVNSFLQGVSYQFFPRNVEWMILGFLIISISAFNVVCRSWLLHLGNFFSLLALVLTPGIITLLSVQYVFAHYTEFLLVLPLAMTGGGILKFIIAYKERSKLGIALSEYVSERVSQEIIDQSGDIRLDGEERQLGIFFSDIEGFTSISEKLSPTELVALLREYLSEMTHIIMRHGGYIDKFEGDAIMALWGAFDTLDDAQVASLLECAIEQQQKLIELQPYFKEKYGVSLKVRMGIHVGSAIIGNIGAAGEKMDFTALGDNINLASRLEGVNKLYGTYICVSQSIKIRMHVSHNFRYLDRISVKGKRTSVDIYELLMPDQKVPRGYIKAMNLYKKRDFAAAFEIFNAIQSPAYPVSEMYAKRCKRYIKYPPKADWDGVWKMKEK